MELAFLTNAIRRYYWVIILAAVVGAMPGLLVGGGGSDQYESRAVLLVAPPSQSLPQDSSAGDPDRYVSGQLSVLRSQGLSERVAEELDDGSDAGDVAGSVRFEREPLTDVVTIVASTAIPERSQAIADAYLAVYLDQVRAQLDGTQEPDLERLDAEIASVRTELADVDQRMTDALAPYLTRDPIPTLEQVAPGLISEKAILLNQYTELQASRTELSTGLRVSSEIVQVASLPTEPLASSRTALLAVGVAGGVFAGLAAASVVARLSPTVLDNDQAGEILEHPVMGSLPALPAVEQDRSALLDHLPPAAAALVESLCVRVEAASQGRATLTVVVTGTQRGVGATTLAAALARRFAENGSRVLLIDADRRHPELGQRFASLAPRLAPVLEKGWTPPSQGGVPSPDGLSETGVSNLQVTTLAGLSNLSLDGDEPTASSWRPDIAGLIVAGAAHADVLVFDGGALMDSVSTVQLTRLCDAVVLAMPRRQRIRALETVAGQLRDRPLLPVWTPVNGGRLDTGQLSDRQLLPVWTPASGQRLDG